jgi:3-phytase
MGFMTKARVRAASALFALFAIALAGAAARFEAAQGAPEPPEQITWESRGATGPVLGDADDCAIWSGGRGAVIGTDKARDPKPGLYVWDLEGRELQFVPVARPNNVDIRRGVRLGGVTQDIVVCNARGTRTMHVFRIDPATAKLEEITVQGGIPIPEQADPYGICLYVRARDGALFVIGSTQEGDTRWLHEYRLEADSKGKVTGKHVRKIGGDIATYVEGLVADDVHGYVYAGDEKSAVRKYHADPDSSTEALAVFAKSGVSGDREGLTLYDCGGGKGWILLSVQGDGSVQVFRREGEPGAPHEHPLVTTIAVRGSRQTDGLDVTGTGVPGFPAGLLAKHDSKSRRFVLYSWDDIAKKLPCAPRL